MTTTLAVEDLALTLPQLLDTLSPGDEVILTRNRHTVAKLTSPSPVPPPPPRPGTVQGYDRPHPRRLRRPA